MEQLLFPTKPKPTSLVEPDFFDIHQSLKHKGVTLQFLWAEQAAVHGEFTIATHIYDPPLVARTIFYSGKLGCCHISDLFTRTLTLCPLATMEFRAGVSLSLCRPSPPLPYTGFWWFGSVGVSGFHAGRFAFFAIAINHSYATLGGNSSSCIFRSIRSS